MAIDTQRTKAVADQVAELFNNLSKEDWSLFQAGMFNSDSEDWSQQQLMDGFAAIVYRSPEASWDWKTDQDRAEEARRERQRRIDAGQIEMFPDVVTS